jgi:LysM repeat protein
MRNCLLFFLFFFLPIKIFSQSQIVDSVFVELREGKAMAIHEVKNEETLYSIAQQYSVPAVVLSQNNDISFYEKLEPKRKLLIPLGRYNYYVSNQPLNTKPLYCRVRAKDSYIAFSKHLGVSESDLRSLNNGLDLSQLPKSLIQLVWLQYQSTDSPPKKDEVKKETTSTLTNITKPKTDTLIAQEDTAWGAPSDFENQYKHQTSNGQYLDSLEGMVVFFKPQTSVNERMLYAFSNDIARGRVLKVVNPSNKRYVFAKIIGRIPSTRQYLNAKIGLDGRAREMLDTREVKLWCTFYLKY